MIKKLTPKQRAASQKRNQRLLKSQAAKRKAKLAAQKKARK